MAEIDIADRLEWAVKGWSTIDPRKYSEAISLCGAALEEIRRLRGQVDLLNEWMDKADDAYAKMAAEKVADAVAKADAEIKRLREQMQVR